MIFARFKAVFIEESRKCGEFLRCEHGFDGAAIGAAADEGTIGTFAENQVERADNDGFTGAGFASDGIVARG